MIVTVDNLLLSLSLTEFNHNRIHNPNPMSTYPMPTNNLFLP